MGGDPGGMADGLGLGDGFSPEAAPPKKQKQAIKTQKNDFFIRF